MRLLDTVTGKFVEKDPTNWKTKYYAILSHAWDTRRGEQTYQELKEIQRRYTTTKHWLPAQRQPCDSNITRSWFSFASRLPGTDGLLRLPFPSQSSRSVTTVSPVPISDPPPHISPAEAPLSPIWEDPELSDKIKEACSFARANGYRYIWIDSCCIDKTSSTELSEAINSMYQWYTDAEVCYAYLADVTAEEDPYAGNSTFQCSRWFTRGWTLQELIAPTHVEFLAKDWTSIGSKRSLGTLVSKITNVHYTALLRLEPLSEFSVAQRLSWASGRQTTRVEDRAYSLLGFFDINMPLLYGEGEGAFRRLQEEIMRRIPDQSIFAWFWNDTYLSFHSLRNQVEPGSDLFRDNPSLYGRTNTDARQSLLSQSPDSFRTCGRIEAVPHHEVTQVKFPTPSYDFTPHGIRTQFPTIPLWRYLGAPDGTHPGWYLVVLGCEHADLPGHLLGRVCHVPTTRSCVQFLYCGYLPAQGPSPEFHHSGAFDFSFLPVQLHGIAKLRESLQIDFKTVHIPYPDRIDTPREVAYCRTHKCFRLVLPKKTRHALYAQGYIPSLKDADTAHPTFQWLALLHRDKSHTILVEFQHTLDDDGVALSLEAYVRLAGPRGLHERPDCRGLASNVSWTDSYPWAQVLDKRVVVVTADSRTVKVTLELHLASPDHYVPHIEIRDESAIVEPSSDWPRLLTTIGSQSESIGTSSELRTEVQDGGEEAAEERAVEDGKEEGVNAGHLEIEREDGDEATPSWWAVPCDF